MNLPLTRKKAQTHPPTLQLHFALPSYTADLESGLLWNHTASRLKSRCLSLTPERKYNHLVENQLLHYCKHFAVDGGRRSCSIRPSATWRNCGMWRAGAVWRSSVTKKRRRLVGEEEQTTKNGQKHQAGSCSIEQRHEDVSLLNRLDGEIESVSVRRQRGVTRCFELSMCKHSVKLLCPHDEDEADRAPPPGLSLRVWQEVDYERVGERGI